MTGLWIMLALGIVFLLANLAMLWTRSWWLVIGIAASLLIIVVSATKLVNGGGFA